VEVATGGGKTTFALACFLHLQQEIKGLKLVVIVPTVSLADQWFIAAQEDAGFSEDEIRFLSGDDLDFTKTINIVIINTARKFHNKNVSTANIMMVVDECHRAGSAENSKALLTCTAATLGLSATPYREFDQGFTQYLEPSLGPVIFTYSLDEAIRDGVLANAEVINVQVPFLEDEERSYNELTGKIARAYSQNLAQPTIDALLRARARVSNNAFYRVPVAGAILNEVRGKRAIVFFEAISQAREAYSLYQGNGHSVTLYHSQMNKDIRRSNLRLFRRGVFDVLVVCRALDEGFNVPEAEVAIIAAGSSSKRQRVQRSGRVLRETKEKKVATIYTLYVTEVEQKRLLEEEQTLKNILKVRWQVAGSHD